MQALTILKVKNNFLAVESEKNIATPLTPLCINFFLISLKKAKTEHLIRRITTET